MNGGNKVDRVGDRSVFYRGFNAYQVTWGSSVNSRPHNHLIMFLSRKLEATGLLILTLVRPLLFFVPVNNPAPR